MNGGLVIVAFAVSIWDIAGNNGALGRAVIGAFAQFGRALGIL